MSPSTRRVWIEIINAIALYKVSVSPSTRRVWIEMFLLLSLLLSTVVTLHTEGVDWNKKLRSVKRIRFKSPSTRRVWIEICNWLTVVVCNTSPSTRRVWIEMQSWRGTCRNPYVTLHTEGVDWNSTVSKTSRMQSEVTLHTEGVDWNLRVDKRKSKRKCHPPHGGCGLKLQQNR